MWFYLLLAFLGLFFVLPFLWWLWATARVPRREAKAVLDELENMTRDIIAVAEQEFLPLSLDTLRQRPSASSWSIGECLQHLNLYGEYYLPALKKAMTEGKNAPQASFKATWLGEYFANMMLPKTNGELKTKMKTFKDKDPAQMPESIAVPNDVLEVFLQQQRQFLAGIAQARYCDLQGVSIPITISRMIRLTIGDTLRFNVFHNIRHLHQAQRALKMLSSTQVAA